MRGRVIERLGVAMDKVYGACGWITRCLLWVGVAAGVANIIFTFVDVTAYKVFRAPIQGSYDIVSILLLITLVSFGSVTLINNRHLSVSLVVSKFPKRVQAVVESVVSLLSLTVAVSVIWYSIIYGLKLIKTGQTAQNVDIPLYPLAFFIAAGFVPIALLFFTKAVKSILGLRLVSK